MMTGTPNVSNLPFAYRLLTLFFLLLFAIYDYRHHKVRNAALLAFLFWCLLSLPLTICLTPWPSIFSICLRGSAGFFTGLTLLLAVSMITDGGIGGGDIKLAALLGIVMGASLLLLAMFTASLAAIIHLELRTLIKKERITDKIVESVWLYGNRPNLLSSIIGTAIAVLELLISKVFLKTLELADKVISKELEARPENTDFKEQKAVPEESRKQADTPKPAIPPRPQPSTEAVSYKHLCEIYQKLQEQNKAIFALEKQRSDLEIELSDSKGIFKAKRRSELSTEIAGLEERIARMKVRLSHIVKEYGYPNVEAFYKAFHKAETAYGDYQDSLKNWKQRYGEKPQSLHDRLKSKKQDIRERELTRPYSPPNRGRSR